MTLGHRIALARIAQLEAELAELKARQDKRTDKKAA